MYRPLCLNILKKERKKVVVTQAGQLIDVSFLIKTK